MAVDQGSVEGAQKLVAGAGMVVELELLAASGSEQVRLEIVPDQYADYARGFLGERTRLAQAIAGRAAGEVVAYSGGDITSVRILSVIPRDAPLPKEVATRRQATVQKAIEDSDRTNAILFASSFSGKWGDYDPKGIIDHWGKEKKAKGKKPLLKKNK